MIANDNRARPAIITLPPQKIARFLERWRRSETLDRWEPQLDQFLRDILAKANEFVPAESGAILLDDPKKKLFAEDVSGLTLTLIAAFGAHTEKMLGQALPTERGAVGRAYRTGKTISLQVEPNLRDSYVQLDTKLGLTTRSTLVVPVIIGTSVCGVLLLINRLGRNGFDARDQDLLEIFAGYISSSMQNTLDAMRASEVARMDDLTGLFNDRYLHYRLREEIILADEEKRALSLIFIDLDGFKQVNDRLGHLVGSKMLNQVGLILRKNIPEGGIAARYGGDEFVIILPGIGAVDAGVVAETLRKEIEIHGFNFGEGQEAVAAAAAGLHVTASFGVAELAEVASQFVEDERANEFIRLADGAMYQAKAGGRNRIVSGAEQ